MMMVATMLTHDEATNAHTGDVWKDITPIANAIMRGSAPYLARRFTPAGFRIGVRPHVAILGIVASILESPAR